ncbi:thiolase family protein [Dactylosporangium sp. NPDC005572]|uniref:thiolase family protein n=1 Tax=Dactylosporangium sp. NPDC005572 TaxID=3156889 RepID=UPI0033BAD4D2
MGLKGEAAIVGFSEMAPTRKPIDQAFDLERWARLAASTIADAGLSLSDVDGIVTHSISESHTFIPSTIVEYLGIGVNFAEIVDLGGATAAGGVWRAAAAIELGLCEAVLVVTLGSHTVPTSPLKPREVSQGYHFGASSNIYGSPQAEFEIPYGNLGQNGPYAQVAQRYAYEYGYDERALAKIPVDQRVNANHHPGAIFHDVPLAIEDVLASRMIAAPLHILEIVMPVQGGAAVLVTSERLARKARHRPVWISGFGEHVPYKTPTYAKSLLDTPMKTVAASAFAMARIERTDVDMVSIYDCYTITVLLELEDAGFCEKGQGARFLAERDLTFRGDFPMNTAGGQLGFGQAGLAGGMHHVIDGTRQIMGRAGRTQLAECSRAFVTGNGGILGEQTALVLIGD